MKTVEVCYPVNPWYCPKCKKLYFSEVECDCDEETISPFDISFGPDDLGEDGDDEYKPCYCWEGFVCDNCRKHAKD